MFADELRFARNDLDWDCIYRVFCPTCRKSRLYLRDDAALVTCQACHAEFGDGSLLLPPSRTGHCHLCHLVAACVLTDGVKRCIPCHVDWEEAGRPEQPNIRPLWTIRYHFQFEWLSPVSPDEAKNAFDQYQSRIAARPQAAP